MGKRKSSHITTALVIPIPLMLDVFYVFHPFDLMRCAQDIVRFCLFIMRLSDFLCGQKGSVWKEICGKCLEYFDVSSHRFSSKFIITYRRHINDRKLFATSNLKFFCQWLQSSTIFCLRLCLLLFELDVMLIQIVVVRQRSLGRVFKLPITSKQFCSCTQAIYLVLLRLILRSNFHLTD